MPPQPVATPARGALVGHLSASCNQDAKQLLNNGYVVLRGAVPKQKTDFLIRQVDTELRDEGFPAQFSDPESTKMAKNLPHCFWGIETVLFFNKPAAIQARLLMREAVALVFGLPAERLVSSFDGIMLTHSKYSTKPEIDPENPKLPIDPKTGEGPGHVDQSRSRSACMESIQCYMGCHPHYKKDMSTCLLIPAEGWTLQGMNDALRDAFPTFYLPPKRAKSEWEGFKLPMEQRDWLVSNGIAIFSKPDLQPGDVLIWSSAVPHCGGVFKSKLSKTARLGFISGFCPYELVPKESLDKLRSLVGAGYATGQQVIYVSKHGFDFPTVLKRFVRPEDWHPAYHRLKEQREVLKSTGVPMYQEEEGEPDWKSGMRSLLGF